MRVTSTLAVLAILSTTAIAQNPTPTRSPDCDIIDDLLTLTGANLGPAYVPGKSICCYIQGGSTVQYVPLSSVGCDAEYKTVDYVGIGGTVYGVIPHLDPFFNSVYSLGLDGTSTYAVHGPVPPPMAGCSYNSQVNNIPAAQQHKGTFDICQDPANPPSLKVCVDFMPGTKTPIKMCNSSVVEESKQAAVEVQKLVDAQPPRTTAGSGTADSGGVTSTPMGTGTGQVQGNSAVGGDRSVVGIVGSVAFGLVAAIFGL
ncbi:hypothetical protein HDV00_009411 [Rhizophlyctis rosea]|nr:hypothetical protein HDV00_009411 [Rhizophlyctis rosea]